MEDRFQGCSALSQGKIRNDKNCFRRLQWVSALFQGKSALKQHWFRADFPCSGFLVFQRCVRENQRCSALFKRKSALKQLWFSADFFALKIWCFSAVSEKISAVQLWFSCFRKNQRWFLALKISVLSAVQSWIRAVQRFSGNKQHWNRPESILNQSWSALNVSETSTREGEGCAKLIPKSQMRLWWHAKTAPILDIGFWVDLFANTPSTLEMGSWGCKM